MSGTPAKFNRHAATGPGPKGSPLQAIVSRWWHGDYEYAALACGHEVRMTKTYRWETGALIPCSECPRSKKK